MVLSYPDGRAGFKWLQGRNLENEAENLDFMLAKIFPKDNQALRLSEKMFLDVSKCLKSYLK